ncbi:hypothetical protein RND81_14G150500 [Saponaria officinalis]|uniref:Reverse transcriptase zinc-binding domain-containing protein n=1 Tax=Saponaria officinalis TaxID=3572 RepID=A0AAW1GNC3_SAPOF
MILINRCCLCLCANETHSHLFFKCPYAQTIWRRIFGWMKISGRSTDLITELHWTQFHGRRRHWKTGWFRCSLAATVFHIWDERNKLIFEGHGRTDEQLVRIIKYTVAIKCLASASSSSYDLVVDAFNN